MFTKYKPLAKSTPVPRCVKFCSGSSVKPKPFLGWREIPNRSTISLITARAAVSALINTLSFSLPRAPSAALIKAARSFGMKSPATLTVRKQPSSTSPRTSLATPKKRAAASDGGAV